MWRIDVRLKAKQIFNFLSGAARSRTGAVALALIVLAIPIQARGPRAESRAEVQREGGPSDPKEVQTFVEPLISAGMKKWHIPGAAFLVVKDGKILFQKGYGYADWGRRIPVDSNQTVFRVGSVSKLFTATAVMQLAERGKLDLHADVNRYLKNLQLPENFPAPVTLSDLLTHTAGFDDVAIGIAAQSPEAVSPLGEYLVRSMPPRVRPPGAMYSYSSHGISLAGYIVETVSALPFADYVQKNILEPLEMRESSFELRHAFPEKLARGYVVQDGADRAVPYDYFNIVPAAGLDSTASDMAHFMIANLERGVYNGRQILSAATLDEMHRQQFTEDPRLPGRTYGFYEKYRNGWRAIGHGGNIRGFGTLLLLIPAARSGIFLSSNVDEPRFEDEFVDKFFDHYFPERDDPAVPVPVARPVEAMAKYAGSYRLNPFSGTSIEKLAALNWQYRVVALADGRLEIHSPHDYTPPTFWVEQTPGYFQRTDNQGRAVFRRDASGRVATMILDSVPHRRVPWFELAKFQVDLVETLLLVFLSMPLVWLAGYGSRRLLKRGSDSSWAIRFARSTAVAAGVSAGVCVVGFVRTVTHMDFWNFTYGIPAPIQALLRLPPFTAVAACGMLVFDVRAWMKGEGSVFDRVYYTLLTAAAIVFVWFFLFWNLLKVS